MSDPARPGAAGAPLPSEADADRYFTAVPRSRSGPPDTQRSPHRQRRRAAALTAAILVLAGGATASVLALRQGPAAPRPSAPEVTTVRRAGLSACLETAPDLTTDQVVPASCDSPRARYIVRTQYELPEGPWPGEDVVAAEADGLCRKFFASSVVTASPPPFEDPAVVPDAAEWATGDRTVYCLYPL